MSLQNENRQPLGSYESEPVKRRRLMDVHAKLADPEGHWSKTKGRNERKKEKPKKLKNSKNSKIGKNKSLKF